MTIGEAVRKNAICTYLALARHAPGSNIVRTPAYTLVSSLFDHPIAHFAADLDLDDASLEELVAIARKSGSFRIHVFPEDKPPDLSARLAQSGLSEIYSLVALEHRTRLDGRPTEAKKADRQQLEDVVRFVISSFFWTSSVSTREALSEIMLAATEDWGEHYFVRMEGEIAAAATLIVTDNIAGIYNVCVKPDFRERGLGSMLISDLVAVSRSRGLQPTLQSDLELVSWYERLGFVPVSRINVFGSRV